MSHPAPETHEPSPKAAAIPARPQTGLISSPIFDDLLYGEGSVLADGARGYAVKLAQTALGRAGYHLRAGADGHFGPATRNLVMRFQRESGLIPTGILDRTTLLKLDRRLEELDKGDRTEALPAPRPLRGVAKSYLENEEERSIYAEVLEGLTHVKEVANTTAAQVGVPELLSVIERLGELDPTAYANVLRALAATHEVSAWAPTRLDLLLALPATIAPDDPTAREALCRQLVQRLELAGGGAERLLTHASPDSVGRLRGAPSFSKLLKLLG